MNNSGAGEILIIKNIPREGPGLFGDILKERGIANKVLDLSQGDMPGTIGKPGAVVILGGPSSANDENGIMKTELTLIREILAEGIPCLGICLGLQTLVKAAGGEVVKSPVKEVGFRGPDGRPFQISLTEEGLSDPLFNGIGNPSEVFQLHGETVILTESMKLLAISENCRNQVIRIGTNAYGIQCHFELTSEMLETWMSEDPDLKKLDKIQVRSDYSKIARTYVRTGTGIFMNFLRIAGFRI